MIHNLQVFGDKAFEKYGKDFISMHFSDQHFGTHKKMLLFKFALPGANHMADMTRLVALVPYYIDLIGRYKLSSQVIQPEITLCIKYTIYVINLVTLLIFFFFHIAGSIQN